MRLELPFPPSALSGHAKGNWHGKSHIVAKWRQEALDAARSVPAPALPAEGDIRLHLIFQAPDNRGDRTNYWNRCKPIIDGIADALGINDKRFLPSMSFLPPEKPGRVIIELGAA